MTTAMLGDTEALLVWRAAHLGQEPSEYDVLFVLAAAERAVEVSDNPPRLFVWLVKGCKRGMPTDAQWERARLRLRAYQRALWRPCRFVREQSTALAERLSVGAPSS